MSMFFSLLFLIIVIIFKNAFFINFFIDDFFFLKIGKANNIIEFLKFFSPFKSYFYRPIPTELFYFFINSIKGNTIIAHIIVFVVYFVGIYFVYRSLLRLTNNKLLAQISILLYGVNFIHVFQLYQLATFIEIALFTFMAISLFLFVEKKYLLSVVFFVFACMSKETAILFPIFLLALTLINKKFSLNKKILILYFLISLIFAFIYKFGVGSVVTVDTYKIQLKPRLGLNNLMWYGLWSLGFPNFMPDYFTSIFKKPIPEFWKVWKNIQIRQYFLILSIYLLSLFSVLFIFVKNNFKKIKKFVIYFLFLSFSFILFVSPTLFIIHKWMVRLTVPLLFITFIEAYLISYLISLGKNKKIIGIFIIILYLILNLVGIAVHESSSTDILESKISGNAKEYFNKNYKKISQYKYIYFKDPIIKNFNPWGGSKKIKVTLGDQNFIDFYLPKTNIKALYQFETKNIPKNSWIINSFEDIIKPTP